MDKNAEEQNKISEYIEQKFIDPSLDINTISDFFDYSPNYFSYYFKTLFNKNFKTYLSETRIKEAQNIISTQKNLPINKVMEQVGYTNILSFRRNFKKIAGILPGDFKNKEHNLQL